MKQIFGQTIIRVCDELYASPPVGQYVFIWKTLHRDHKENWICV
jgi:hypothetical protein